MKAHEILQAGIQHMQDRASTYDKPEGERSMPPTVEAFNAITGHNLTAEQGWIFMAILKAVRSQHGGYREDSYQDGAAYFALAGEQAAEDRDGGHREPSPQPECCVCASPLPLRFSKGPVCGNCLKVVWGAKGRSQP